MNITEVFRAQGLRWPRLVGEKHSAVRSMVGNAMTVPVIEKLVSILLLTIKGIDTLPPLAGGGDAETSDGAVSAQLEGTAEGPLP